MPINKVVSQFDVFVVKAIDIALVAGNVDYGSFGRDPYSIVEIGTKPSIQDQFFLHGSPPFKSSRYVCTIKSRPAQAGRGSAGAFFGTSAGGGPRPGGRGG